MSGKSPALASIAHLSNQSGLTGQCARTSAINVQRKILLNHIHSHIFCAPGHEVRKLDAPSTIAAKCNTPSEMLMSTAAIAFSTWVHKITDISTAMTMSKLPLKNHHLSRHETACGSCCEAVLVVAADKALKPNSCKPICCDHSFECSRQG